MRDGRIEFVRDGRPHEVGGGEPYLSSSKTRWSGFALEAHRTPDAVHWPDSRVYVPRLLVGLIAAGQAGFTFRNGTKAHEHLLSPGKVSLFGDNYELSAPSWSGEHEVVIVEVAGEPLDLLMRQDERPAGAVTPQMAIEDSQIALLLRCMKTEIEAHCPAGKLYGQLLSATLASYVFGRYARSNRQKRPRRSKLSSTQIAQVIEYIDVHLTDELCLTTLAGILHLSPHYFSLLFKNAYGISPYQYVIRKRVERAKNLIATGEASILEIALMLGFSSQSHFTDVFRRVAGVTPCRYQQGR